MLLRPVEQHNLYSNLPMAGYIDYYCIKRARREGNIRRQRPGHAGYEHYESPAQITPKEWSEDPYILCILLSIAQHQYYHKEARHNTTYRVYISARVWPRSVLMQLGLPPRHEYTMPSGYLSLRGDYCDHSFRSA